MDVYCILNTDPDLIAQQASQIKQLCHNLYYSSSIQIQLNMNQFKLIFQLLSYEILIKINYNLIGSSSMKFSQNYSTTNGQQVLGCNSTIVFHQFTSQISNPINWIINQVKRLWNHKSWTFAPRDQKENKSRNISRRALGPTVQYIHLKHMHDIKQKV